tara:strand:- start:66 stop:1202 length:1137 start_codon:yes stop_codon:yes gene_type:complete
LGTIEFIVDVQSHKGELPFFFLEMNTRLQVEHPVTEEILGMDLVELQINIAAGKKLDTDNDKVIPQGHAIEARIYAEDPKNDFLPSPGFIQALNLPKLGRFDFGVRSGDYVSTFYDPMLGKIIVHANDRDEARTRLVDCLEELKVQGIETNTDFLSYILSSEIFKKDVIQITDLDDLAIKFKKLLPNPTDIVAATLIILNSETEFKNKMWRLWGTGSANLRLRHQEKSYAIKVNSSDGRKFQLEFENQLFLVENVFSSKKDISFDVDQRLVSFDFQAKDKILSLYREGLKFVFENITNIYQSDEVAVQERKIVAPITGSIAEIMVKNGQMVSKDEVLVFVEAMKMEYKLVALKSGRVLGLKNKKGDLIEKGDTLLEIE